MADPTFPTTLAQAAPVPTALEASKPDMASASEAPQPSESGPGAPVRKRRVNTSSKGAHVELLAIRLLEAEGYKVHRCVRTGTRRGPLWISQSNDVFGCIDLVAKKLGHRTRWIQVTAHSGIGQKKQDLDAVPWDPQIDSVEIWRWVGGGKKRHKATGAWLERQYFQVYHFDDGYQLRPDRRIKVDPGNPTLGSDPFTRTGEVSA